MEEDCFWRHLHWAVPAVIAACCHSNPAVLAAPSLVRSTEDGCPAAQPELEVEFAVFEVTETHDYDLVAEALDFGDLDSWLPLPTVEGPALLSSCEGCGLSCLVSPLVPHSWPGWATGPPCPLASSSFWPKIAATTHFQVKRTHTCSLRHAVPFKPIGFSIWVGTGSYSTGW